MTLSPSDLALYAFAIFILFMTPGPVWVAIMARAMSGGFRAAWPLALGVAVGDAFWPLLAVLGVSWLAGEVGGLMIWLRYFAAAFFIFLGASLIRKPSGVLKAESRLTKPGVLAGFLAGVAVILGNPKAILFYMGMLPGFFDLTAVTRQDIAAIVLISIIVPFFGNLAFAALIAHARTFLKSPEAIRLLNVVAGVLLVFVGAFLGATALV
ncbi:LysE family translocator [Falsihalocynthiibacter arcticus]|uniref:Lysine transporter LysE n=1 Tax=Falsihalocynthiibacter arcticus TaxID=1579316 RepID=A0A126UY87_9RHOB|nr:LysE family translocator [Falsihalocynthiibacter arcticus]AML51042.1 lysine transporter LysE [Falsihalocynthiibacter arcticus]